ncbi:SGNH/GDSL hydrolase family protein [Frigoribacterium faeni]|uniref:SGNH/GDSL hydrolase family protein n=1 Tax=Frigoribacterium faeni TaxID=145483 RepID=UPI0024132222|nr:SGNH/GDSL hydrolase family protein [Frigoribacterium faeni]
MSTTALFIGDSITDAGRRTDPSGHLGAGYVRHIAAITAGNSIEIVNRGIGGDRICDLRRRWDEDCLQLAPDVVTILVGVNDTWRRYTENDPTTADSYRHDYIDIVKRTQDAGISQIIILEPFVIPINAEQRTWKSDDLDAKRAVAREIADEHGLLFIPLQTILADAITDDDPHTVVEDGVHPSAVGHETIAHAWLQHARALLSV